MAAFQRRPVYISSSFARSLVLSNSFCSELGDMTAHPQSDRSLALPTIGEQHETELSLESDVDHKTWKPDRKVKMALGVQTFCVVRASRSSLPEKRANNLPQFIISLDMTILTATLPVSATNVTGSGPIADSEIRPSLRHWMPPPSNLSG